jgi:hypothetical protein
MKRHWTGVLALAGFMAVAATPHSASAQRFARNMYQSSGQAAGPSAGATSPTPVEELPPGHLDSQQLPPGNYSDPFVDDSSGPGEFYPQDGYYDGYHDGYFPSDGPVCGDAACHAGYGGCYGPGQFFFTADYLYVRAHFSEADAYVEQIDQGNLTAGNWKQLDFGYNSSYRFGGGYRLCGCGDEIRFLFTRLTSDASDYAIPGDIVPYEASPPPDGITSIHADVDVKTYDVEFVKRIPLGGCDCCECGDPCCGDGCGGGCGDPCCSSCPSWDLSWSGGFRYADVNWRRSYVAYDDTDFAVTDAGAEMKFHGAGVRMGLEGRRYFFQSGWLSAFMRGDISLLLGDVEIESSRATDQQTTSTSPDTIDTQSISCRNIIPVTEIETGLTAQVTCHSSLTAGYLFSAWHDLGFRDEPEFAGVFFQPPTRYDDANILGFDGFFARLEWAY